jgi:hypothetical protein
MILLTLNFRPKYNEINIKGLSETEKHYGNSSSNSTSAGTAGTNTAGAPCGAASGDNNNHNNNSGVGTTPTDGNNNQKTTEKSVRETRGCRGWTPGSLARNGPVGHRDRGMVPLKPQ